MRCLIVDDDESPRRLMSILIERNGHAALAVADGRSATAAAARTPFDVAIVDLELPDQSGLEIIAELRRLCPLTRILVVSGYDDRRHVLAALEAGADGYLLKDEVATALGPSLQSVRAGHTPLSPRVASIVLRQLRRSAEPDRGAPLGRLRPVRPPLADGTGAVPCLPGKKPLPE